MALEQKIEELTGAVNKLIAALDGVVEDAAEKAAPAKKAKPAAKKKAQPKKKTASKKPAAKKSTSKIDYDRDVKPQVLLAIATPEGREEVKALLEEYEVKNAQAVDEDDYPAFLESIEAIIEKYEDDE